MTTFEALLAPDESLLLSTRAHAAALMPALLRALGIVALCGIGVLLLRRRHAAGTSVLPDIVSLVLAGAAALAALRAARDVWRWDRTLFGVTTRRIVVLRTGSHVHASSVRLDRVERVAVRQTTLGRVLGYGTVELHADHQRRGLSYMPQPGRVGSLIMQGHR